MKESRQLKKVKTKKEVYIRYPPQTRGGCRGPSRDHQYDFQPLPDHSEEFRRVGHMKFTRGLCRLVARR